MEATSYKKVGVRPPTTYLEDHLNLMNKTFETQLVEQGRTYQRHSSMDPFTRMHKCRTSS